ncbi:MAG: hypothetical protein A4E62_00735 [Syntrophorhabdus sp. PtaU1.Bin002]|nr:MAG: hypothetical protein A4E62_00735 [Syntrophorhabdus sp. PtaU1.Bin002]
MSTETLTIANLDFEVRRSARRKTSELTVDRTGELVLHAPESASTDELYRWAESKLVWVHRKLITKEAQAGKTVILNVVSGETIAYLGRNYRLKLVDRQDVPLKLHGEWFCLKKTEQQKASVLFRDWYRTSGTRWVEKRIATWTRKIGVVPQKIGVGDLGFRWGSCGRTGALRFNWRLFSLPVKLIDYVIVHEMAHLQERNHTPEFWRILDRVLPDWRQRKDELGRSASSVIWHARPEGQ